MTNAAVDEEDLNTVLIRAKRAGYAGADDDESVARPLLPHSKELRWEDGPWAYRDVYFGMTRFTGLETLSHEGRPVWAMAYKKHPHRVPWKPPRNQLGQVR